MRLPRPALLGAALLALSLAAGSTSASTAGAVAGSVDGDRRSPGAAAPARSRAGPSRRPPDSGLRKKAVRRGAAEARRLDSTCFAVLRKGKLVGEWNWQLPREEPREVFSITKSVTSTLVGIAVRDGDLRLDDPVSTYVPQWRGTASASVTVRNLLSNDSGRFWSLQSDYADLLAARSRTRYAVSLPQQYAPGSAWAYNNAAIQVLEPVLEKATGMPVARFARERLFEPLGMTRSSFITDRADDAAVFYGLRTTCLDIARLGRLYLDSGKVGGKRILDAGLRQARGRAVLDGPQRGLRLPVVAQPARRPARRDRPGRRPGAAAAPGDRTARARRRPSTSSPRSASAGRCCSSTRRRARWWSASGCPPSRARRRTASPTPPAC